MRQMKAIIAILTLISTQRSESLPVTSKALDNNSDQLIWQTAWYSQHLSQDKKETPYTGESRKITAKSIFITPNFNQNTSHCPPGYKIDDNGKCIKVVNINQDEILVTQLLSFFSQHQTTDDTTSIDYDYSLEEDNSNEPTHFTLPLIPILNDNDTSLYTINEPQSSTPQYEIELNEYSFREPNSTKNSSDASTTAPSTEAAADGVIQTNELAREDIRENTTIDLLKNADEKNSSSDQSTSFENSDETHVNASSTNWDEKETTTESLSEETNATDSLEESTGSRDILNNNDDNYSPTPSSELVINKSEHFDEQPEAEKTISNSSNAIAIHLDDYFDSILLNDSLLIDKSSSIENTTDFDYVTTLSMFSQLPDEESSGDSAETKAEDSIPSSTAAETTTSTTTQKIEEFTTRNNDFPYENRIIKDDKQIDELENDEANKFVYHHLSATEGLYEVKNVLTTPSTVVRFPSTEGDVPRGQRVRFPDDSSPRTVSVSWPRDNGYHLMRFWQEQPLINDFKFPSRGNSRAPSSGGINRMSNRRNY